MVIILMINPGNMLYIGIVVHIWYMLYIDFFVLL